MPLGGLRSNLIHRPGEGLRFGKAGVETCPKLSKLSYYGAAAAAKLNGLASTSMRCMMTASLRASATFAVFMPARLAILAAQLLRFDPLTGRVRMTWAASYRAVRTA